MSRLRVMALGASNTAGYGVGIEASFPAVLERQLRARGWDVAVRNAGISGNPTGAMLARLDQDVPTGTHLVLFQPGSNDLRLGVSPDIRERNVIAIHNRLAARGVLVLRVGNAFELAREGNLQADGVHFTAAGHVRIADLLLDDVAAALRACLPA